MKTIHLIRHAKSCWKDELLSDIDRPLNKRGHKASSIMAEHILHAGCKFEHVFCSPAVRAQTTLINMRKQATGEPFTWSTDTDLYCFDGDELMDWFSRLDESLNNIVVVGHNPAFNELVQRLTSADIENIPTCGYVQLVSSSGFLWRDIADTRLTIKHFLRPKHLKD
ncbi:SixA phosphatase family protein [Veronia pacifica]|uniref:Phosphoglycerate mutase n=1 Tax=Veronia pacifica TaxID=1080227 RepID=A0A1C3ER42_9GAMM|nr:histidine phosphatase family protein [Veronia pacifica]ODA35707.1 hypothetical protein A8L45_03625 [Veronia pacifica]